MEEMLRKEVTAAIGDGLYPFLLGFAKDAALIIQITCQNTLHTATWSAIGIWYPNHNGGSQLMMGAETTASCSPYTVPAAETKNSIL